MKISPLGVELFQADRRTDRYDEANSRFAQFCERAWKCLDTTFIFGKSQIRTSDVIPATQKENFI
jgi:hypothetical protein